MTDQKRPYRMTRRAELEEQTRLRITEAAIELHGTVGPARTSVTAVAERAGVRRSTVYRHFPDEAALFAACSGHWIAQNPRPDLSDWAAIEDPDARLRHALEEFYSYYRASEGMLANLLRDEATMPVVQDRFVLFHRFLDQARDTLLAGRRSRGAARRRERAAIGHALAFATWRSLTREQELGDREAALLMARLVAAARAGS
jgi:AcrR family transcriptional regulator